MSLHQDIETTCHTLKHLDAADIDLDEVRALLRRCQRWIEQVESLGDVVAYVPLSAVFALIADE